MSTRLFAVVVDSNNHVDLARWWANALELAVAGERENEAWLAPPDAPELIFVPVPEPKATKNRLHFDLASTSDEHHEDLVQRLTRIGAKEINIGQPADANWTVLADPEGNEFCISPPNSEFTDTGPIGAIAFDQATPNLSRFWTEATGWPIQYERGEYVGMRAASGRGPFLTMGPPVAPKPKKNRLHLDVAPPPDGDIETEVKRLTDLGARRVDIGQGDVHWVVLADPENNEFCVLTPR